MSNTNQVYDDRFIRRHKQIFAQAKEHREKQLTEQQEMQSAQEKIQQQLLIMADLKAQIAAFQNTDSCSDSIITKTTSTNNITNPDNPDALSADEEQYQTTIVQKMVALIQQRKKR